jgi:hypothetical protein
VASSASAWPSASKSSGSSATRVSAPCTMTGMLRACCTQGGWVSGGTSQAAAM